MKKYISDESNLFKLLLITSYQGAKTPSNIFFQTGQRQELSLKHAKVMKSRLSSRDIHEIYGLTSLQITIHLVEDFKSRF